MIFSTALDRSQYPTRRRVISSESPSPTDVRFPAYFHLSPIFVRYVTPGQALQTSLDENLEIEHPMLNTRLAINIYIGQETQCNAKKIRKNAHLKLPHP